jgi:protease I
MNSVNKKSVLLFLPAKDFNEEEYSIVRKLLLKYGKNIFITSDDHYVCSGSKGMKVKSDTSFYNINIKNFAALVLIGGNGCRAYWDNEKLHKITRNFNDAQKIIGAICSAPVILAKAGILKNKSATCYYEDKNELINLEINYQDRAVVIDKNIVTSNGSQSAAQFTEAVLHLIK